MASRLEIALRRVGLEIGRPGGRLMGVALRRITLPDVHPIGDVRRGRSITVPMENIVTSFGFSYATEGWHPYWEAAEAMLADPALPAERSPLRRFYDHYQPTTVADALFPEGVEIPPLGRLPARYTAVAWTLSRRQLERISQAPLRRDRNMNFGPATPEYLRNTHEQLRRILSSVETHGYQPDDFPGGLVEGFFLIRGDDYRFIPTEGQHRLGPLRALGVGSVSVVPRFGLSGVSDSGLQRWTTRRSGPYDPDVARRLLDRYFEVRPRPYAISLPGSGLPGGTDPEPSSP